MSSDVGLRKERSVEKLIRGIARGGREDAEGIASFQVRKIDRQHLSLRLQRSWEKLALTSRLADIAGWMDRQPTGPWWSLLREGLEDLFHELGDRKDVIEWLAEWGRDARKRQTGLLLLSAHRAKGLDFDDVVVLDGGWDRPPSNGEGGDPERRLYYVAMTRAAGAWRCSPCMPVIPSSTAWNDRRWRIAPRT